MGKSPTLSQVPPGSQHKSKSIATLANASKVGTLPYVAHLDYCAVLPHQHHCRHHYYHYYHYPISAQTLTWPWACSSTACTQVSLSTSRLSLWPSNTPDSPQDRPAWLYTSGCLTRGTFHHTRHFSLQFPPLRAAGEQPHPKSAIRTEARLFHPQHFLLHLFHIGAVQILPKVPKGFVHLELLDSPVHKIPYRKLNRSATSFTLPLFSTLLSIIQMSFSCYTLS